MSKQQRRIFFVALSSTGLFFGVLAFAVVQAQLFSAGARDGSVSMVMQSSSMPTTTSTARGPIQNLRFTVYDAGLYPRQLRAKPGVVAIVLEDRTRRRPGVVVERETGGGSLILSEISFPLNQSRTRTELRLGVGRYRVFDATNPANQAELIIQQ